MEQLNDSRSRGGRFDVDLSIDNRQMRLEMYWLGHWSDEYLSAGCRAHHLQSCAARTHVDCVLLYDVERC